MAKDPFLLVSLEESESKNLAQVMSNDTARKILDYLSKEESATESAISKALDVPLSTVHYNLQALVKANLVKTEEFHYSEKGKEVLHYSLANKIIIIAPKKEGRESLMQKLKGILPVAIASLGAAAILQVASKYLSPQPIAPMPEAFSMMAAPAEDAMIAGGEEAAQNIAAKVAEVAMNESSDAMMTGLPQVADNATQEVANEAGLEAMNYATNEIIPEATKQTINLFSGDFITLWFLAGSLVAILAMLAWNAYTTRKGK